MRKARIPGANVSVRRRCDRCITTSYASGTQIVRDKVAKILKFHTDMTSEDALWVAITPQPHISPAFCCVQKSGELCGLGFRPINADDALQALAREETAHYIAASNSSRYLATPPPSGKTSGSKTVTMKASSGTPSHWLRKPSLEARSKPKRG